MRTWAAVWGTGIALATVTYAAAGKIVFTSDRDGNPEIYLMDADGGNALRLTNNKAYDDQPSLAPKGDLVVFVSNRDGNNDLYLMDTEGKNIKRLTRTDYSEMDPRFTPDGEAVTFTTMAKGDKDVAMINLATGEVETLVGDEGDQFMATLAPDGSGALVYVEGTDDRVLKVKEAGVTRTLVAAGGIITMPAFTPDGGTIIFASNRGGDYDILAVPRAGGDGKEVITWKSLEGNAVCLPDGKALVVASDYDGDLEIYLCNWAGERLAQLTQNEAADYEPSCNLKQ